MPEITTVIAVSVDAALEAAGVEDLKLDEYTAKALAFGKTGA
ncbi:hypothetical protein H4696_008937 [Amycolatopsis lexingtonensis]|uniref:Uncharacterized protein n=1 Tax=Amycolatopsis lexingtonensis TaxID=218822 RepID=A0ABR9IF84_9PSEU|nr:hypothetical protein [Amycolatopsis lexingtonensis]MBE1501837.1 hypothetical protein [Amycolatopsis lexingtonensis]